MEGDEGEMGIGEDSRLPEPLTTRIEGQPGAWGMALAGCRISAAGCSQLCPVTGYRLELREALAAQGGADHRHNGPASRQLLIRRIRSSATKPITDPND